MKALKGKDEKSLQALFDPRKSDGDRSSGASRALRQLGGDAQVKVVDVTQDVSPDAASAKLNGSSSKGRYAEHIGLTKHDGKWWAVLGDGSANAGPTAGTGKPSS